MVSVSIDVDRVTLGDFRTQMNRLVTELGKSPEEACRMGAVALLKSLQSQTRIAPKTRKVKTDPNWKNRWVDSNGNGTAKQDPLRMCVWSLECHTKGELS